MTKRKRHKISNGELQMRIIRTEEQRDFALGLVETYKRVIDKQKIIIKGLIEQIENGRDKGQENQAGGSRELDERVGT